MLSELQNAKQVVHNIELLQQEELTNMSSLLKQTDQLNCRILKQFKNFRERPVRTKHFSKEEKALTRQVVDKFEDSSDEEAVKLEGIKLGDGKYGKLSHFTVNVRKLQKLISAQQTIDKIKQKRSSGKNRLMD